MPLPSRSLVLFLLLNCLPDLSLKYPLSISVNLLVTVIISYQSHKHSIAHSWDIMPIRISNLRPTHRRMDTKTDGKNGPWVPEHECISNIFVSQRLRKLLKKRYNTFDLVVTLTLFGSVPKSNQLTSTTRIRNASTT